MVFLFLRCSSQIGDLNFLFEHKSRLYNVQSRVCIAFLPEQFLTTVAKKVETIISIRNKTTDVGYSNDKSQKHEEFFDAAMF